MVSAVRCITHRSICNPTSDTSTPDLALPGADAYYSQCLSLPLYPSLTEADVDRVVETLAGVLGIL